MSATTGLWRAMITALLPGAYTLSGYLGGEEMTDAAAGPIELIFDVETSGVLGSASLVYGEGLLDNTVGLRELSISVRDAGGNPVDFLADPAAYVCAVSITGVNGDGELITRTPYTTASAGVSCDPTPGCTVRGGDACEYLVTYAILSAGTYTVNIGLSSADATAELSSAIGGTPFQVELFPLDTPDARAAMFTAQQVCVVSHRLSHRLSTVFLQGVKLRVDDLVEGRMPCATLLEAVRTLRTGEILPLPSLPVT